MSDSQTSFDFLSEPAARRVYGVRELVAGVRAHLERGFADVWVEGEISNYRPADSGHLYFTLKDGEAQLRVVMFRSQARLLRFRPQNGLAVLVRGRITLYEARGEMQLLGETMEPRGAGALQLAFEQLKTKLAAEGLFAAARKKTLPPLPRRIGVITSPRGAVIRDILNVLGRRHQSLGVLIFPAQVQGATAAAEVSAGVQFFNQQPADTPLAVDVIVIARGGGSLEDLAAFNDEALARTIAASRLPVISAVGHETDFTITDFVADLRAPTPSAAAELVVGSEQELHEAIAQWQERLQRIMQYKLNLAQQRLAQLEAPRLAARLREALGRRTQRRDDLHFRLATLAQRQITTAAHRLDRLELRLRQRDLRQRLATQQHELTTRLAALGAAARHRLLAKQARFAQLAAKLDALSPLAILGRGYALLFDERGALVKDVAQLSPGTQLTARLAHGSVTARVESTTDESARFRSDPGTR